VGDRPRPHGRPSFLTRPAALMMVVAAECCGS